MHVKRGTAKKAIVVQMADDVKAGPTCSKKEQCIDTRLSSTSMFFGIISS
jgi:hypothetical protein